MKLALSLPGFGTPKPDGATPTPIPIPSPENLNKDFTSLSSIFSAIINLAFFIAVFIAFYWLVWAAFQYISAGGNKETLAKARGRIIWALVGLMIILLSFTASKFFAQVLNPGGPGGVVPF